GLVFILFALGFILYRGVTAWIQKKRLGSKVLTIGFTLNRFLIGALINTFVSLAFLVRFINYRFDVVDGVMCLIILLVALFFYSTGLQKNAVYQGGIVSPNGPRTWEQIETFHWYKSSANTILFRVKAKTFFKVKKQYESWKVPPKQQEKLTEMLKANGVKEATDLKEFVGNKDL
ncbi:MAG TPA: hypothetical protein VHY08_08510, partial [Bacillota bacterium]|nr:hypothetical protein [Bacillota bacterium]